MNINNFVYTITMECNIEWNLILSIVMECLVEFGCSQFAKVSSKTSFYNV